MITQTNDDNEIAVIKSKPFGGTHMLFTGDFYQLKPIQPEAIYTTEPKSIKSKDGQKIWHSLNEYVELTENTRYKDDTSPYMNQFLSSARKGKVDLHLLNKMNERVMTTYTTAKKLAGPDAVWIAHENKQVNKFNKEDFNEKIKNGACYFRILAEQTPASQLIQIPDDVQNIALSKITKPNGPPPYLDLAVGMKVSCTRNLGTQIGKSIKETFVCMIMFYILIIVIKNFQK